MASRPIATLAHRAFALLAGAGIACSGAFLATAASARPTSLAGVEGPLATAARIGVLGSELPAGCHYQLVLDDTVIVRDLTVGHGGRLQTEVVLPAGLPAGTHTIRASPLGACPSLDRALTLTVLDKGAPRRTPSTPTTRSTTPPTTPSTTPSTTTPRGPKPPPTTLGTVPNGPATTTTAPGDEGERALPAPPARGPQGPGAAPVAGRSLVRPALSAAPGLLAVNAGVAAVLVALIAFPAELFNTTLEEHYDEITGWLERPRRLVARLEYPTLIGFAGFAMADGAIASLVDSRFGLNFHTLALTAGFVAAFVVTTLSSEGVNLLWMRRRRHVHGRLRVFPLALLVTVACVAVSRSTHLVPGYVFGILAGYRTTHGSASEADEAKGVLAGVAGLVAASVAAFALRTVWAPGGRAGDVLLSAVFCAGIESLVCSLLPLRFLDGHTIWRWSPKAWALSFGAAAFLFVQLVAHPQEGYAPASATSLFVTIGAFVAFGIASFAFWAWFRFRPATRLAGLAD